ncbi:MAG: LytR C-terminal domain-containing protein [Actinomycetota bacterium]|nr:LytR C-terminal domain-containing protein [Actinomycetota bacterium]
MQWRTPITLAVLLMILLGAAYYGWRTVVDPATDPGASTTPPPPPTSETTKQVCLQKKTYPKGATIRATSFKVNVYNAGGISGQAGDVLTSLHSKGFQEGVAANPPPRVMATNVSILTSTPNSPLARLVQEQFKGKVRLVPGPNLAVGVDIVIGANFIGVNPSAPNVLTLRKPATVCVKFTAS